MLLLEPSLRYALGGNFLSAVQSEGAAATELFYNEAARVISKQKVSEALQVRDFLSDSQ